METLIEDSRYIMKKWRIGNEDLFPAEGGRSYSIETKNLVEEQFSVFNKATLVGLYLIYQGDFEAFGYELPDIVKNIMEFKLWNSNF